MTQVRREGQVTDEYSRPVPGSSIYVFNEDGTEAALTSDGSTPLVQPVPTDQFGMYSYYTDAAVLREDTYYASKLRYREEFIHGEPPAFVGPQGPGTDLSVQWDASGAVGDGATDDTTAIQGTVTTAGGSGYQQVRGSGKDYGVSGISLSAGIQLRTAGPSTVLKQLAGTADGTRILSITGSGVRSEDVALQGQIATSGGEQNHGAFCQANAATGSLQNVSIGNIDATNIRGDPGYVGATNTSLGTATITIASPGVVTKNAHGLSADAPVKITTTGALPTGLSVVETYYVRNPTTNTFELAASPGGTSINTSGSQSGTHTLRDVSRTAKGIDFGYIFANNAYRNGLTVAGGSRDIFFKSIFGGLAGLRALDIEPNSGEKDVRGVFGHYIEGRAVAAIGAGQRISGVNIGAIYLDKTALGSGSTPTYVSEDYTKAFQFRDASGWVGTFKANGYDSSAIAALPGALDVSRLSFDNAEITNCAQVTATDGFITGFGQTSNASAIRLGFLKATTTNASHKVIDVLNSSVVDRAEVALLTSSKYIANSNDISTRMMVITRADSGNGGIVAGGTRNHFFGGVADCDRFFSFATRCVAVGVDVTVTSLANADVSGTNNAFVCSNLTIRGGATAFYYLYALAGTLTWDATGNLNLPGGAAYKINGAQVLGARKAGWTLETGVTLKRTALSAYESPTAESVYTQATIQTLMNQVRDLTQEVAALKADLHATAGHGIIGT